MRQARATRRDGDSPVNGNIRTMGSASRSAPAAVHGSTVIPTPLATMYMGQRTLRLADGTLRYDSLGSWMGYKVDYDRTRPWLLATCLLALCALSLHYLQVILKR